MARPRDYDRAITIESVSSHHDPKLPLTERIRMFCVFAKRRGARFISAHEVLCETGADPESVLSAFVEIDRRQTGPRLIGGPNRGWSLDVEHAR